MESTKFENIKNYILHGFLPTKKDLGDQLKANFIAQANKFEIVNGKLFRNGLPVLHENALDELWKNMHSKSHSIFRIDIRS